MVRWLVGAEVLVLRLGLCRAQMYGAAAGPGGAPAFVGEAMHAAPPLSASVDLLFRDGVPPACRRARSAVMAGWTGSWTTERRAALV